MTATASEVYADVVLLYKLNIFQSWTFFIKIYNILKNNILTCSCWASVESWLLWRNASRSSLLYSGFRYIIELPLQPYKIQLYTFWVQGLAIFLSWFLDYKAQINLPIYVRLMTKIKSGSSYDAQWKFLILHHMNFFNQLKFYDRKLSQQDGKVLDCDVKHQLKQIFCLNYCRSRSINFWVWWY